MRAIPALLLTAALLVACADSVSSPTTSQPPDGGAEPFLVSCTDQPFDAAGLEEGGGLPPDAHPAAGGLATIIAEGGGDGMDRLPRTGWRLVAASPTYAQFVAPTGDGWAVVAFAAADTGWVPDTWGECVPVPFVEGRNLVEWQFDPDRPRPGPDATTATVLATERACASGKPMGDRLQPPAVTYTDAAVVVLLTALPQAGGQDCPGNPSTPVTIELDEPLGNRRLLDGSVYPPVDRALGPP